MTIGMITSWQERCGIAAYSEKLVAALSPRVEVRVIAPPKAATTDAAVDAVAEAANAGDLSQVEHEYTLLHGLLPGSTTFLPLAERFRRPVVLTAHSLLPAERLLRIDEERRWARRLAKRLVVRWPPFRLGIERDPFLRASELIVHTRRCRE